MSLALLPLLLSLSGLAADQPGPALLDDRLDAPTRAAAARTLGESGDPEVLWILRAAVRDGIPEVQQAAMQAAAGFDDPEAASLLAWVLTDRASQLTERRLAVTLLTQHGSEAAGLALWHAAADKRVPARLRGACHMAMEDHYGTQLAALGPPRNVVDPLGGGSFILANGVAGGVALSSVGVWGQFEGATAVGGVGGSAIGLGTGAALVGRSPLTSGQGLAYSSGVGWGLAFGAWTTSTVHGPWTRIKGKRRQQAVDYGAAYRLTGVVAGAGVGAYWLSREPSHWDVLEVDLAGYLGSAVVLAATGLAVWDPSDPPLPWYTGGSYPYGTYTPDGRYYETDPSDPTQTPEYRAWETEHRKQSQVLAGSTIAGAVGGLAVGVALQEPWELEPKDAAFATAIGLEAAWIGNWTPDALEIEDRNLKGTVRLPWNAAIIGGLALAEAHPMSWQTTAVTSSSMVAFNGLGAGVAMLGKPNKDAVISQVMLPVGLAGTTAGVVAAPWLDPGPGEWAMVGVGSTVATLHGPFVGGLLVEKDVLDDQQLGGLTLTLGGTATPALLIAGHYVDPKADDMLAVGAATAWGQVYGFTTPYALRTNASNGERTLTAAVAGDVFGAGMAVALTDGVGLRPKDTLYPQLGGIVVGTTGALGAAMFSSDGEDVALGWVIGSAIGLTGTAIGTSTMSGKTDLAWQPPTPKIRLPGTWTPTVAPRVEPNGTMGGQFGLQVTGW